MAAEAHLSAVGTTGHGADLPPARRPRPKNRKARIAAVAAEAFSEHGYHGVGMDDIAAAVGISGPALYRHFPGKYALFRSSVETLVTALAEATELPDPPGRSPAERLESLLESLAHTSIEYRRSGGLYRWEARFLAEDDRRRVIDTMRIVMRRLREPIAAMRPALSPPDVRMRATAVLSIMGSITGHRSPLAQRRIAPLLVDGCLAVVDCPLPTADDITPDARRDNGGPPRQRNGAGTQDRRETLLKEALTLFARHGYHEVGIEDIASASGLTASGVYRYFSGKPALLDAAFQRVLDGLGAAQNAVIDSATDPDDALRRLTRLYVRRGFRHPDQLTVYFAEIANLPPGRRRSVTAVQRKGAHAWARLLVQVRPELSDGEARYLVHAAYAVILDVGRLVRFDPDPQVRTHVEAMITGLLFGRTPESTADREQM